MLYYPLVTKILFGFVFLPLVIESDFRNACRRTAYNTPISSSSFNNVIVHGSNGSGHQTIVRSSYLPQQMLQRLLNANVQIEQSSLHKAIEEGVLIQLQQTS